MSVVIHSSMGKTRYELSDYILNCSEDELYEVCSVLSDNDIQVTEWSCDECKRKFSPNCQFDCDEKQCKKYFSEMNQPFTIRRG